MVKTEQTCSILSCPDSSGVNIGVKTDGGNVAREDRVRRVLAVLVDSGCAMPPVAIFRNAKLRGADFERRVLDSYLKELHERGLVKKVKPDDLDNGDIVEIPLSEEGWFMATEAGAEELFEE